jgi:hypothetical protein
MFQKLIVVTIVIVLLCILGFITTANLMLSNAQCCTARSGACDSLKNKQTFFGAKSLLPASQSQCHTQSQEADAAYLVFTPSEEANATLSSLSHTVF